MRLMLGAGFAAPGQIWYSGNTGKVFKSAYEKKVKASPQYL